jgi:metallo-beta-lactamase family protein
MKSTLTFCGGAGSVTGADFLLETGTEKLLIDCGTEEREYPPERGCDTVNTRPFPYKPSDITALLVTHSHQDHIGRIPRLVRDGFRGEIHSTAATKDISALMFEDALHVMEGHSREHGCEMLYSAEDVKQTLALWHGHDYHERLSFGDMDTEFLDAGHILGSAMVRFTRDARSALFTGDLGNTPEPLLHPTESPAGVNYIIMESVYGDRLHEERDTRKEILRAAVEEVRERNGVLLIPSFSVERTQILLFELNDMVEEGGMRPIPVYLDSPLAVRVTKVFKKYPQLLSEHARTHFEKGDDPFSFPGLQVVQNSGASHALHRQPNPKIIIAGAGMSGGGRVRAHEKAYLGERHVTVLFAGYQAPGTLGRRLEDGEKQVVIDGERIRVHARFEKLTGYSGHADRDQLLHFIEEAGKSLERVYVTMGEPRASLFLAQRAHDFLGVDARVPQKGDSVEIEL